MSTFWQAWADRRAARAARRAPPALGLTLDPLARPPGSFARGRRIAAGAILLDGKTMDSADPFAAPAPSPGFAAALHGWGWLDDLAACGEPAAREAARRWLDDWLARCSTGRGPGWRADLTGRRVLRWLDHALFLIAGADPDLTGRWLAALGAQAAFLARRWPAAPPGLPRIEALTGWLHAGLMLRGLEGQADPALAALTDHAAALIGPDGGIPNRCPEDLLWITAHLAWCRQTLQAAERPVPPQLDQALLRAARALKALRHADGGMPRFHGGGAGPEGLVDRTLALSAPGDRMRPVQAMGFVRLQAGRTTVIVDAAAPPQGPRGAAATLGFELTSGRRPVVVGCGPGAGFGPDWDAAGRATAGASTLGLDGASSAAFGHGVPPVLRGGPAQVSLHRSDERHGTGLILAHDGWVPTNGLTHTRHLDLSADGRALMGEDALAALTPGDRARLDRAQAGTGGRGLPYAVRFHLHPDAEATVDPGGNGVRITLMSGEVWLLRTDGPARLGLEPSVWMEPGRRAPRPCRQIVLRGVLRGASCQINWTLAKSQDTPLAIRDLGRDEVQDGGLALPPDFLDRE